MNCITKECTNEAAFTVTLTPRFLPSKPIDDAYIAELRKFPGATIDYHADCHLSAMIEVCDRCVGEAVEIWSGWLDGSFNPEWDGYDIVWATEEDLVVMGTPT